MSQTFDELDYYEILELHPNSSYQEVEEAYQLAKKSFHPQSSALYGILAQDQAQDFYKTIEEAYHTLIQPRRRQEYDQILRRTDANEARLLTNQKLGATQLKSVPQIKNEIPNWALEEESFSGAFFQKLRHHKGLTLEDISHKLKIKKSYILAIESEDFESLPSAVYVRGYVKSIASILGLDSEKAANQFMTHYK